MDTRPQSAPEFDLHAEQAGQRRDLVRFDTELDRALISKIRTTAGRTAAAQLRDHWERLKRRLDGRWARSVEVWDRQIENVERLRRERDRLQALVDFEEHLTSDSDLEAAMKHSLRCITRSVPCDGAYVILYESSGQTRRIGTERGHGRMWPPAADLELAEVLATGARAGQRIIIDGRPVGTGPREKGRVSHWLAIGVMYDNQVYGAIVLGRLITEPGFGGEEAGALATVTARLGRYLTSKVGIAARPVLEAGPKPEGFEHLVGQAPAFRKAVALAANYAPSDTPILIEGELGTGRRTLARAIHLRSNRNEKPFVTVAAASLPEDVIVRSLFGARSVSADGAADEQPGDIELANGGTLFLDEVTALGPVSQVRLLRVLQDGIYEHEGDRTPRQANVRLIVATTADLDRAVASGTFRPDLYYQITVARVPVPSLRDRGSDILELARRFAQAASRKSGRNVDGIDVDAARLLAAGTYPGNVGQLAQIIERAVLLAKGSLITTADLPATMPTTLVPTPSPDSSTWVTDATTSVRSAVAAGKSGDYGQFKRAKKNAATAVERAFVEAVISNVGHNWARAARHCGIHRAQWQRLLRLLPLAGARPAREEDHKADSPAKTDT